MLPLLLWEDTYGAQDRNRTSDTVIFSHVLYQLSYLGTGSLAAPREGEYPRGAGRRQGAGGR